MISEIRGIIAQMQEISTTIATAVEEQTATTREIARNVTEAALGDSQVTKNVTSVAEAAKSNSAGAQSTQVAASQLARGGYQSATDHRSTKERKSERIQWRLRPVCAPGFPCCCSAKAEEQTREAFGNEVAWR